MFHLKFNIDVPWSPRWDDIWAKDFGYVSRYKALEMQLMRDFYLFGIEIDASHVFWGRDHAGPEMSISLLGYTFRIQIYDVRHWDYEEEKWEEDSLPGSGALADSETSHE